MINLFEIRANKFDYFTRNISTVFYIRLMSKVANSIRVIKSTINSLGSSITNSITTVERNLARKCAMKRVAGVMNDIESLTLVSLKKSGHNKCISHVVNIEKNGYELKGCQGDVDFLYAISVYDKTRLIRKELDKIARKDRDVTLDHDVMLFLGVELLSTKDVENNIPYLIESCSLNTMFLDDVFRTSPKYSYLVAPVQTQQYNYSPQQNYMPPPQNYYQQPPPNPYNGGYPPY